VVSLFFQERAGEVHGTIFSGVFLLKPEYMDKDKKNRSGSQSNDSGQPQKAGNRPQSNQPGAPNKSNRQTGGSNRQERDDSSRGADRNTTKKGENAV
jgi:hypothetical protein